MKELAAGKNEAHPPVTAPPPPPISRPVCTR
jgi:hypothetical protein